MGEAGSGRNRNNKSQTQKLKNSEMGERRVRCHSEAEGRRISLLHGGM
jgi:hypothetical protein